MLLKGHVSEIQAATHSDACRLHWMAVGLVVDDGRCNAQAEVIGDIKLGERCIDISINDGQRIDADQCEDAEITVAAVTVFALAEEFLIVTLVSFGDGLAQMEKTVVTLC